MKAPGNKKMQRIIPILILLIAGVAVYRHVVISNLPEDIVTANGTIEAIEMDISPRVSGRIATLNVDEGDSVKKGEVIAVLDAQELNARVSEASGALVSAKAKLSDLIKGTREEKIRDATANYEKALASARGAKYVYATVTESHRKSTDLKSQLVAAQANYKAALKERDVAAASMALVNKGPRQEEVDRLKANLDKAKAQFINADQDYKRYAKLHKEGAISTQSLDESLSARDSSQAAVNAAKADYEAALTGSRPEEKAEARAKLAEADARLVGARQTLSTVREAYSDKLELRERVENAKTNLDASEAQLASAKAELDLAINGATSDEIKNAQGQVNQAQAALAEARSQLSQTTIKAPEDGLVTVKSREVGEVVSVGTPIVRIANLNRVWLRVYAPLPTLGKIKIGQRASVYTDTYKGKVYRGRVMSIKEEPEFTPKNVQTTEERVKLVYAIRIDINNNSQELKPGMPADAIIRL